MISAFDKAVAAILSGLMFFLAKYTGIAFFATMTDETFLAISGLVTTIVVYLVPNKDS